MWFLTFQDLNFNQVSTILFAFQEWEEKAKIAKANYEVAMAEYREKMKDAASGDSDSAGEEKKKKKPKKAASPRKSPKKAAGKSETSGDFKSKEFISSDDSSSDSDKPLKKKAKKKVSGVPRQRFGVTFKQA